jgi:hypothetical protein
VYLRRRTGTTALLPTLLTALVTVLCAVLVLSACIGIEPAFEVSQQDIPPASAHPSAHLSLEELLTAHMKFLTSDFCLGRMVNTGGATRSAQYVIDEFRAMGLSPAYRNGYADTYKIPDLSENTATLELVDGQGKTAKSFAYLKEFVEGVYPKWGSSSAKGSLAMAPTTAEDWNNVKAGSVLLATYSGTDVTPILNPALQKKCAGVLLLNTATGDKPFFRRLNTEPSGPPLTALSVTQSCYDKLLRHVGETVNLTVTSRKISWTGVNVAGVLGDPARQPTVVVCAHRDSRASEDGRFVPTQGGTDNASGTAALLEIARALKSDPGFKGAAVFLAVDGEEIGLTGSREFAKNPPFKSTNLALVLNLDCIAARGSDVVELYATVGNGTATAVRDAISASLKAAGLNAVLTDEKYGSDQRSFENVGCPAVVIHSTNDSYGQYIHTPQDTVNTVDIKVLAAIVRGVVEGVAKGAPRGQ